MGITAIASGIFSIAKAVPYVFDLINLLSEKLLDHKIKKIDRHRVTTQNQRDALILAISKAETNEELIAHSVTLQQLNNPGILRE